LLNFLDSVLIWSTKPLGMSIKALFQSVTKIRYLPVNSFLTRPGHFLVLRSRRQPAHRRANSLRSRYRVLTLAATEPRQSAPTWDHVGQAGGDSELESAFAGSGQIRQTRSLCADAIGATVRRALTAASRRQCRKFAPARQCGKSRHSATAMARATPKFVLPSPVGPTNKFGLWSIPVRPS
jgi:hypothetical protein